MQLIVDDEVLGEVPDDLNAAMHRKVVPGRGRDRRRRRPLVDVRPTVGVISRHRKGEHLSSEPVNDSQFLSAGRDRLGVDVTDEEVSRTPKPAVARGGPSPHDAHDIVFCRAPDGSIPARDFLNSVPAGIRARINAVAIEVAAAPPMKFSGGGYWEAMSDEMSGWFEIRVDGPPNRTHYRVFCLLDYEAEGVTKPLLVLVDGRAKPFRTVLRPKDYAEVRDLGDSYRASTKRPIA